MNADYVTPLQKASTVQGTRGGQCVKLLLAAGAQKNAADMHGGTALMKAADANAVEAADALLEAGVDTDLRNMAGETAAAIADRKNANGVIELFRLRRLSATPAAPSSKLEAVLNQTSLGSTLKRNK